MSRCFPFPPPGYVLKESRDKALIESIKGAEEKAKKEQRRQERKREKKEKKKKEKKEKRRKEREGGDGESEKRSHKRHRKEEVAKNVQNQKVEGFTKLKESKSDCLEKSILTVEPQLLQSTSQNSCESTLNSNELLPKPKEKQPLDGRHNNDSENIIRIRLPIQRHKDPEVMMMMTNKDQQKPCPSRETKLDTSRDASRAQPTNQLNPCSTSAPQQASKPHERKRKDHISARKLEKVSSSTQEISQPSSSLCRKCPPSMSVQFLSLVENWVPNRVENRLELTNSEDEECWWSIKKPSSHKLGIERCKTLNSNNETKEEVMSSTMVWPRTHLLAEADVHALPYTVLF